MDAKAMRHTCAWEKWPSFQDYFLHLYFCLKVAMRCTTLKQETQLEILLRFISMTQFSSASKIPLFSVMLDSYDHNLVIFESWFAPQIPVGHM